MSRYAYYRTLGLTATGRAFSRGSLPVTIISRKPLILVAFSSDFIARLPAILKALPPDQKCHVLWKLGYECETDERIEEETAFYRKLENSGEDIECTYLCNTIKEVGNLTNVGIPAIFCNQNCFLDESRLPVMASREKLYDAIYLARVTPCKRHHLASKIKRLHVIGSYLAKEREYALQEMKQIPNAVWTKSVRGYSVPKHFGSSHVGLCLSDREGAMYTSAEYLLCGLPVVSTPNIGGRDEYFDPGYVRIVEPNATEVEKAVYELIAEKLDPYAIRDATLSRMEPHRQRYMDFLESVFQAEEKPFNRTVAEKSFRFHKLGLRATVSPRVSWRNRLRPGSLGQ